jgi:hypothetical protein
MSTIGGGSLATASNPTKMEVIKRKGNFIVPIALDFSSCATLNECVYARGQAGRPLSDALFLDDEQRDVSPGGCCGESEGQKKTCTMVGNTVEAPASREIPRL